MNKWLISLFVILCASAMSIASVKAAVYEAPFVATGGGQVPGSEGKVNEDGSYKVEIPTAIPNTKFEVCRIDFINGPVWLADVTTTDDGELKKIGLPGAILPGNYEQFGFLVSEDSGDVLGVPLDDCSGTLRWVSGFTLLAPAP